MFFGSLKEYEGMKPGLSRIKKFLKAVGDPQEKLQCVHIAGTNGKGSVAAFIASILQESGYKTGLYTSPHLVDITERIKINGSDITQTVFDRLAKKHLALAKKRKLSYFEYLTAIAFIYFAKQKVDVVVLETGLGGRFDATNVIKNPLVSVITSISLDHTEILGSTIEKIAFEKSGIIKNSEVVCGSLPEKALKVISRKSKPFVFGKNFCASRKSFKVFDYCGLSGNIKNLKVGLYGKHQIQNAAVAICALEVIKNKSFEIRNADIKKGLLNTKWPARFDIRKIEGAQLIVDGAHNPEGISAFLQALKEFDGGNIKRTFIFAAMKEKDYKKIVKMISPYSGKVILPKLLNERAVAVEKLKKEFAKHMPSEKIYTAASVEESLKYLTKKEKAAAAGSLYLAGEIIRCI